MKLDGKSLARCKREFSGYLQGRRVDEFFHSFGIKFAAGHWCAGDFCDRFAPAGYNADDPRFSSDVVSQLRRVARAGIRGVELHDMVFLDHRKRPDTARIAELSSVARKLGLTLTNLNIDTWSEPVFKLGGVTNTDARVRREALRRALQAVEIAASMGFRSVALWPGSDGWDYNFQVHYGRQLRLFIDACVTINRAAKRRGLLFGIEAKPHEPREQSLLVATTQKAMLIASHVNRICGGRNMGVAIDYGHEMMYNYEPADNLYLAREMSVPITNFHINTAKAHSNDEDRIAGVGDVWRFVDFCYAAIETRYNGWMGLDQFTYRQDPVRAMALSKEFFANCFKKALLIYAQRRRLTAAQRTGDSSRTMEVVKKVLFTG